MTFSLPRRFTPSFARCDLLANGFYVRFLVVEMFIQLHCQFRMDLLTAGLNPMVF